MLRINLANKKNKVTGDGDGFLWKRSFRTLITSAFLSVLSGGSLFSAAPLHHTRCQSSSAVDTV